MEYKEFKMNILDALKDFYGSDATVELATSEKNNGIKLEGIIIRIGGANNVAPIIYLEQYYREFSENNSSIDVIVGKIIETRDMHELNNGDEIVNQITDWDYVQDRIYPMVISTENNEERLSNLVAHPFLDLSVILYVRLDNIPLIGGDATVKVTKRMLESLDISEEEAFDKAMDNMKEDGYHVQDIFTAITGMIEEDIPIEENCGRMFVVTNDKKHYGACGGILDMDLLKSVGKNLFILPSSLHEVILVPEDEDMDQALLDSMVQEVNVTQVSPEEVLSNHSYYYDFCRNEVMIDRCA